MPLVFSFLTLINSVSFIYDLIRCHAIINSRGKPCWSGGRRAQHPTGASQDQASKWLHFSNSPAYSPRETYSRNVHLQMSLIYTSSPVIMKNCHREKLLMLPFHLYQMVAVTLGACLFSMPSAQILTEWRRKVLLPWTALPNLPWRPHTLLPLIAPTLSCSMNHSSSLFSFKVYLFYIWHVYIC